MTTNYTFNDVIEILNCLKPEEWELYAGEHSDGDLLRLTHQLEDIAALSARMSAYMNHRYLGRSHKQAVNHQNSMARAVWRLFHLRPASDIQF